MRYRTGVAWIPGRILVKVGVAAIIVAICAVAGLHVAEPDFTYTRTLSEYAHVRAGWLFTIALGALVLASVVTLHHLNGQAGMMRSRLASALLAVWSGGLAVAAIYPTDVSRRTMGGTVHNIAAGSALLALPVAALVLSGQHRRHPDFQGFATVARWLASTGMVMFGVFLVTFIGMALADPQSWLAALPGPNPVGLAERVVVLIEISLLTVLLRWPDGCAGAGPASCRLPS